MTPAQIRLSQTENAIRLATHQNIIRSTFITVYDAMAHATVLDANTIIDTTTYDATTEAADEAAQP